jgi:RHS repeat-associated protein
MDWLHRWNVWLWQLWAFVCHSESACKRVADEYLRGLQPCGELPRRFDTRRELFGSYDADGRWRFNGIITLERSSAGKPQPTSQPESHDFWLEPERHGHLSDAGSVIGTVSITGGVAILTTSFGTSGVHSLSASYGGDAANMPSTSSMALTVLGPVSTIYRYDASGNQTQTVSPVNSVTSRSYDLLNRPTTLTQPPVGGSSPVITTTYDAQDNVTQVTDPRTLATTYTVDGLGNRKATASPDAGANSATYDAAGNVLTRTDARGKTTGYTYDSLNRLTQVTPATGTPIVYEYDGGPVPTPPPNSRGRLTKLTDESGSTSWTYDGLGRVLTKTQIVGFGPAAKTFTVAYEWGASGAANGKLTAITYPSGSRVAIGYDAAGRALSAGVNPVTASGTGTDLGTTLPVLSALAYNGANDIVGWTWGDGSAYARSFDSHGRLATYALAGTQRSVAYDNGYGIVGFTHSAGGTPQPALDHSYGYDALDRLTSASVAGTSHAWGYDATGNRTSRTIAGAGYANTVAPTSNRLATVQSPGAGGTQTNTYVHDAAGNLTQDGAATFTYGDRGRMTSAATTAGSVTYLTNGLEQRVMKAGPTSLVATGAMYYVYDEQGKLLGQYDANLTPIHETLYLGDLPVAVIKHTGSGATNTLQVQLHYVYADQINTPRVIARASDHAVVWRWDQAEAFGATPPDENPSALGAFRFDQRFPGQVFDAETGNHDNWHRSYRPATGRYDSYDPIGLAGGINPFGYVGGNPVNYSDPDGLQAITVNDVFRTLPAAGALCASTGGTACAATAAVGVGLGTYWLADRYVNPWAQPLISRAIDWCMSAASDAPTQQECDAEWLRARNVCFEWMNELARPNISDRRRRQLLALTGGNMAICMSGQVSEACGGTKVELPPKQRRKKYL